MKPFKKILSTILLLIGVLCIFLALVLTAGYVLQKVQNEQIVDSLRPNKEVALISSEVHESSKDSNDATPSREPSAEIVQSSDTAETLVESSETSAETPVPDTDHSQPSESITETVESVPETEEIPTVPNPYADSFLANGDMAAWLTIPGTVIDYPVMWTPFDENYYLYKDFYGKENSNGCLLLDTDSNLDPLTTNLIIHGHNMKSGAMFGNLTDYADRNYYEDHKQITLHTKDCQRNYEVIAVFRSQVYRKTDEVFKFYKFFQADTEEEFNDFYDNIKALSLYDTGVTAQFGDHFITLSTCVYHVENGRFVVVAKEVEPGDSYQPIQAP